MQIEKLFHVLVVGGALMAVGSFGNQLNASTADPLLLDSDSDVKPALALCPGENGEFCEVDCSGKAKPKAGIECCWGTSCDAE